MRKKILLKVRETDVWSKGMPATLGTNLGRPSERQQKSRNLKEVRE